MQSVYNFYYLRKSAPPFTLVERFFFIQFIGNRLPMCEIEMDFANMLIGGLRKLVDAFLHFS